MSPSSAITSPTLMPSGTAGTAPHLRRHCGRPSCAGSPRRTRRVQGTGELDEKPSPRRLDEAPAVRASAGSITSRRCS
jgi:hypothetical protein